MVELFANQCAKMIFCDKNKTQIHSQSFCISITDTEEIVVCKMDGNFNQKDDELRRKRTKILCFRIKPRIQLTLFSNFKPFCCVASKHKSKVVSSRMESFSIFDHKFLYTCFLFSRLFFISKLSCVSLPSDKKTKR